MIKEKMIDESAPLVILIVEYNEIVTEIFDEEHVLINGPYGGIETTEENLASVAFNAPKTLNAAPIKDEPYNYDFVYDGYNFKFSYDGNEWTWSYENK